MLQIADKHFDWKCRHAARMGGFLYRMKEEKKLSCVLNKEEFGTLCKINEEAELFRKEFVSEQNIWR